MRASHQERFLDEVALSKERFLRVRASQQERFLDNVALNEESFFVS